MFGVVDRVALANKAQTRRLCALRPGFEMPLEAVLVAELDGRGPVILLCLGRREARKVLAWCQHIYAASRLHLARVLFDRFAKLRRDCCHRERLQSAVESPFIQSAALSTRASHRFSAHCKKGAGGQKVQWWTVPSPPVGTVGTVQTVCPPRPPLSGQCGPVAAH